MAWDDTPTDKQLDAVYNFISWQAGVSEKKSQAATVYLRENATRRDVSEELGRLRNLCVDKKLNADSAFDAEIWSDFEYEGDLPTRAQIAFVETKLRKTMPIYKAVMAANWLKGHATKKQVSEEIDRLKKLESEYQIDEELFTSPIWADFESW